MKKILTILAFMSAGMAMAQTEISTRAELEAIEMDGDYVLTADIDLSGSAWTPLGNPTSNSDEGSFTGTFDGNGYTISGLNFDIRDNITIYMGLIGRIGSEGVVKNLNISGSISVANTEDNSRNIGAITGVNHGLIDNCTSSVAVKCYAPSTDGGGISGENQGTINNCVFTGSVETTVGDTYESVYIGGIVGNNETGGVLSNCKSNPTEISDHRYAGAVYAQSNGTVYDCYAPYGTGIKIDGRMLVKDGNWNTICLPFDVTISGSVLDGATVMELDIDDNAAYDHVTGIEETTLYLNFKEVTTIKAGQPYIIKWTNGDDIVDPVFSGVSFTADEPISVTSADGSVSFVGTLFAKDFDSEDKTVLYMGAANTLYYPSSSMQINALRAYFQLNGYVAGEPETTSEGEVNCFTFRVNNETTGIDTVKWSMVNGQWSMDEGQWYDMSGRQVDASQLKSGLYIKDGKKILIRH